MERVRHEAADVLSIPFLTDEKREFSLSCWRQFLTPIFMLIKLSWTEEELAGRIDRIISIVSTVES